MPKRGRGAGGPKERETPAGIVINGWSIFAHPLFLNQVESLIAAVESEIAKGKHATANQKVLSGVFHYGFVEIPRDPNDRRFRLGNTLGPGYRHWFRARFGNGRFRLFYRFQSRARIIVLAWVNDERSLRTRGSRREAYVVFRRMLQAGSPPDSWEQLFSAAASSDALSRLRNLPTDPGA